jgi:glucose uptake protein GlcU
MTSREFKLDVLLPFAVGMVSLACILALILSRASEWFSMLFMPGVYYASWKLTPYLYGWKR